MKKYNEYKDFGIKWLGEIPEHWKSVRLKFLSEIIPSNVDKKTREGEKEVFLCNYVDVYKNDYITRKILFMRATASDVQIAKLTLSQNDVIATKDSEDPKDIGVPALVKQSFDKVVCGYHLTLMRSNTELLNGNFLYWFILSDRSSKYFYTEARGITRYAIGSSTFKNLVLALPPLEEQTQIANYLDSKTQQIEALIDKKERLIALLEEERTAIINQAVTKGLDPNVKMRDSGIDWLGEIPGHWELVKLKYLTRIRYGLGQPPMQKEGGLPIIRATNIFRGTISEENMIYVDPDDLPLNREPILKENEIIVVRSGAYTADSAIIDKKWEGTVTGYDLVMTPKTVNPKLLSFALLSTYMLDNQLFLERLRAAQPHLNSEELGNTFMLLPPDFEQSDLVDFIENELLRLNEIKKKVKKEIDLLKEYKTALISEVVTGKVDVREEALN